MRNKEAELRSQFQKFEDIAKSDFKELATRKETAQYFLTCEHPQIMFSILDGKDYSGMIWKMIRPDEVELFRKEILN